jgi:hypothetical protein
MSEGARRGDAGGDGVPSEADRARWGAVRRGNGALVQVRQRRRWRACRTPACCGLRMQFYLHVSRSRGSKAIKHPYPTHNSPAALAVAHEVSRASAHLAARQLPPRRKVRAHLLQALGELRAGIDVLRGASQRVFDELVAILEQVGAELPARAREVVQCLEIELAGKLSGYTVALYLVSSHQARSQVLAQCGSGSRITAQGG